MSRLGISEVLEGVAIHGRLVEVSAVLVLQGRECFLVPDFTTPFPDFRVCVFHPGLEESLDSTVGGWVGGPASYFDLVTVEGFIRLPTTRRDVASISDIRRLSLFREGEAYEVVGQPQS